MTSADLQLTPEATSTRGEAPPDHLLETPWEPETAAPAPDEEPGESGGDLNYRLELSREEYQKAYVEVAFLLDAFASTIDNIMGGKTAPVGRIAGRDTARKLPLELEDATLESVVAALGERMQAGFEFNLDGDQVLFQRCILREMCRLRDLDQGSALCRLFHAYFDGIVNGLLCRPVKSELVSVGEQCRLQIAVQ